MAGDANVCRLELELTRASDSAYLLINLYSGQTPFMPRSRKWAFEIVLLKNDSLDADVGNISSVVLEVKPYQQPTAAPLISVSITGAGVNAGLQDAERIGRSNQHFILEIPQGSTGLDMTGGNGDNTKNFSLVITATRSGSLVTLGRVTLVVENDGGQYSGNTPTAGDPTFYTKAEIDGLLASFLQERLPPGKGIILTSTNELYARFLHVDDDGNFQAGPYEP